MNAKERIEALDKIAKHYGTTHQLLKLTEELGELQAEAARYLLKGDNREHLAEEAADALIMILQVTRLLEIGEITDSYVEHKLYRQLLRMEAETWE